MAFSRPHYIPENRRANLAKYKYSGADHSILSRYVLTPYWNNLVKLFPKTIAPNMITLMGLGFVLINFTTLLTYEPSLACAPKPLLRSLGGPWDPLFPPSDKGLGHGGVGWLDKAKALFGIGAKDMVCPSGWMFGSFALGLWLYQSFDAIDGKQARRTGTSGPLGELFDHGCDALNTTLECILCASALNLGQSWWTVVSQVATLANFYLTTWEEFHTGTLFLSAFSGPVEGIIIIIGIFTISAVYGPGFWDQGVLSFTKLDSIAFVNELPIKNLPLNECFLLFGAAGLFFNILASYSNVRTARRRAKQSTLTPLIGLLPFAFNTLLNILWLRASPTLLRTHLVPFMIYWGFSFAYSVGLLIVSHVLKAPEVYPSWHGLMVWSAFGCLDANLPLLTGGKVASFVHGSEVGTVGFVWISLAVALVIYGYFVIDIILDVCAFCDINCLTIKKRAGDREHESSAAVEKAGSAAAARRRR